MTANQIEYWKLQETKRHNIVTESMDIPLKRSQTEYNYASIGLITEQAKTQETVRAMNLAAAAASYASAEYSYAGAEERRTQSQLNIEKQETERRQQEYVTQQAGFVASQTAGQNLKNEYQGYVNQYAPSDLRYQNMQNMYQTDVMQFSGTEARARKRDYENNEALYAWGSNVSNSLGFNANTVQKGVNQVISIFAN